RPCEGRGAGPLGTGLERGPGAGAGRLDRGPVPLSFRNTPPPAPTSVRWASSGSHWRSAQVWRTLESAFTRKVGRHMGDHVLGVAMNGVTGRMGYRQHLTRSVLAIRDDGGVELPDGSRIIPEPILVGRSAEKLRAIAERHGIERWSTDLDTVLSDDSVEMYFDAQ